MLGADVVVAELQRLAQGQLEDLLGPRGERNVTAGRLLTLAETRQLAFDKRDVNVANVINSVIDMFSAEAQEKNISLSFSEKNGNLSAVVDPQRFEQVISNLVGNAIRYVPEGGRVWVVDGFQRSEAARRAGVRFRHAAEFFSRPRSAP